MRACLCSSLRSGRSHNATCESSAASAARRDVASGGPAGANHALDVDEFLARGAFAGGLVLGFLDLLPVSEGHHVEITFRRERIEAGAALLGRVTERAAVQVLGDLVDHAEAVGAVGADGAGRPAPRPADRVEAGDGAPFVVGGLAR